MIQTTNYTYAYKNEVPKFVSIAPVIDQDMDCTVRKYNYKNNSGQAASIARRNARERNRVKQVNDGFNALRKRLPAAVVNALSGGARRGSGKKLSKVDTLRMVVEYIRYLENLIEDSDSPLEVTHESMDTSAVDEGIFGRTSPYSDSVPSPTNSECSSGVSSSYSNDYLNRNEYPINSQCNYYSEVNSVDDSELLDAITMWQQK